MCIHKKAVIRFECFHSIGLPLFYVLCCYVLLVVVMAIGREDKNNDLLLNYLID